MLSLNLARGWYAILGFLLLILAGGSVAGALQGSSFEWQFAIAGIGAGILALGAALWVQSRDRTRAVVAWLGIVALAAAFLMPLTWNIDSIRDRIVFAWVPTAIGLLAAARMAWARGHTPMDGATAGVNAKAPADPA